MISPPSVSPDRLARRTAAIVIGFALVAGVPALAAAQRPSQAKSDPHAGHHAPLDSSFAALQRRGKVAMGVDQDRAAHRFDDLADGGRIELQSTVDDSAAAHAIREHLATIAQAFAAGDFTAPAFVHDTRDSRRVPGAVAMAALRAVIRYEVRSLPRGAALRITSRDPEAIRAVHQFLAFQRAEHRAPGDAR